MGQGTSKETFAKTLDSIQTSSVPQDSELWHILLTNPLDEHLIIPVIKAMRQNQPDNLSILINKLVDYLQVVTGQQRGKVFDFQHANYCLGLLARIIPFVFDYEQDSTIADKIFWHNIIVPSPNQPMQPQPVQQQQPQVQQEPQEQQQQQMDQTGSEEQPQQPLQTETKVETEPSSSLPTSVPPQPELPRAVPNDQHLIPQVDRQPLAVRLMECLLDMLYHPGYTVDWLIAPATASPREQYPEQLPTFFSWQAGFGVETIKTGSTKSYWANRLAVLQCLLSCLSEQLYIGQENSYNYRCKWLEWITSTQSYYTETLLYTLLNTFCNYDPIGWGVPYNHMLFSDHQEAVAKSAIEILNILLSYDHINQAQQQQQQQLVHTTTNGFALLVKNTKRSRDYTFFFNSFERILGLNLMASHTKLPNSTKKIEMHQELLITFWRFISLNHDFLSFVTNSSSSPEFLVSLLQYMDEGRKAHATHGLVQIGTFILLVLSGERDFAISLNKTFNGTIVIDIPKPAGYSDFIIIVLYRMLMEHNEKLESIFECILTVLSNLSPYMKNLSMMTCVKLMKLFEYLSSPKVLFANNHNHRYVHLLLETFNSLLQHQYESNTRLLYAILRCQNQFSKLAYLKITNAVVNDHPTVTAPGDATAAFHNQSSTTHAQQQQHEDHIHSNLPHQNEPSKEAKKSSTEHVHRQESESSSSAPIEHTKHVEAPSSPVQNEWIPTDEWLQSVKRQLPLDNILKIITNLSPQIQRLCSGSGSDEQKIMEYLRISTTVGLFPAAGPIMTRKYHANPITKSWFIAYMWCIIYLENQSPPLFCNTNIKLFQVRQQQPQTQQSQLQQQSQTQQQTQQQAQQQTVEHPNPNPTAAAAAVSH
ncbi:hypothetical protein SAMD00019534_017850 [Acytostelium subglobosum LB1]|uniref:hypothetical protein n=1 Tax=Acytostelium subglobosum LB1 TaxID=1410327 RepID=UPI000644B256|nr:hypothetical protein SAMD00019534_017850 [Acytostelium subglobosum LB1]GAM18610.1 hypothetical protein SAMD00019534_017850 [Acytostelium subglobosum LB1]|eukprot:XP_012757830.1 hypothetical protein SAMD00019534_017850 [Acytostelium subglobosum LB1]